jgi:anhydro-N-acetylmuramic acid kinase
LRRSQPEFSFFAGIEVSSSLQLASPSALSQLLNLPVVGDFRSADIALGGNGAPLVPIFDYGFLRSETENVIALNIGGISNITYIPANSQKSEILASDCGPGNILIDLYSKKYYNKKFDKDGNIPKGKVAKAIKDRIIGIEYEDIKKMAANEEQRVVAIAGGLKKVKAIQHQQAST